MRILAKDEIYADGNKRVAKVVCAVCDAKVNQIRALKSGKAACRKCWNKYMRKS